MYINEVVSYLGAWETFQNKHPYLLDELQQIFENVSHQLYRKYKEDNSNFRVFASIKDSLIHELDVLNWDDNGYSNITIGPVVNPSLGLKKDSCYIKIATASSSSILMSWIYSDIQTANRIGDISIPILLVLDFSEKEFLDNLDKNDVTNPSIGTRKYLKFVKRKLERISPLTFEYPFLILGVGFSEFAIKVLEVEHETQKKNDQDIKIDRCITFEPEYYQAGIGILSYFGTVLRDKYPDQNATVKIEQHDLTVRMIIETEEGNIETLEKALHEYELVLKGQKSAEEFYLSPIKALELKNQLHLFKFQIESQKEIIALQRGQILSLEAIVDKALAPITQPPLTIVNRLSNTQTIAMNHRIELNRSYDDLDKLIDITENESLKKRLERALIALDAAQNLDDEEEVKNSGGMKQLAKILNEANEVGSEVNDLIEKGGQAVELIKNLGRKYNSVAEWCGLPVIPSFFVKG